MIDIVSRSPHKSASLAYLRRHIAYLSDPNHEDHKGKVEIHPCKIFNCKPTTATFVQAVIDADNAYIKFRSGQKGKRTGRIWDEAIYRTPDQTDLTEEERAMVEFTMLSIKRDTPTLLQWHRNIPRGSWDLHDLTPAKSSDWPPRVHLSAEFGAGKKHVHATLERLDQELVDSLNEHRPPHKRIVSARVRRKQKAKKVIATSLTKGSLASLIAKNATGKIAAKDLPGLVQALGITVKKISDKYISILFQGRKQPRRYDIAALLRDIADAIGGRDGKKRADDSSGDGTAAGIA